MSKGVQVGDRQETDKDKWTSREQEKNLGVEPQAQSRLLLTEPKGRSKGQARRGKQGGKEQNDMQKKGSKGPMRLSVSHLFFAYFLSKIHSYENMTTQQIQRANKG